MIEQLARFNKTVQLLTPYMHDEQERSALVNSALHGCSVLNGITWTGEAYAFTVHLVRVLERFGECSPGRLAIVLVLEKIRDDRVGVNKVAEFNEVIKLYQTQKPKKLALLIGLLMLSLVVLLFIGTLVYRQINAPGTKTATPTQEEEDANQQEDQLNPTLTPTITPPCEATTLEIGPASFVPSGTTMTLYGEGTCRGNTVPRASRFRIDGEGYGEDAVTGVQNDTWQMTKGEHEICFEITVGPWEVAGRKCQPVTGE